MNKLIKRISIEKKIKDFINKKTFCEKSFDNIFFLLIKYQNMKFSKTFIRDRIINQFKDLNKDMILINRGIKQYSKENLNKKINNLKIIIKNCFKEEEKKDFLMTLEYAYACKNLYDKLNIH